MALPSDAQARKHIPLWSGVHEFFPAALAGVARVTVAGSIQHHGPGEVYDDRSKSNDDRDCLLRHLHDAEVGDGMDGGVAHVDKVAWRALRYAQKWHEARGAQLAPAARNVAKAKPFPDATDIPESPLVAALIELHDEDAATENLTAGKAYMGDFGANPISQTTGD